MGEERWCKRDDPPLYEDAEPAESLVYCFSVLAGKGRSTAMIEWREYLVHDPKLCHGQLCAKGTRVFVTTILDSLAEGASRAQILQSYPTLQPVHIDAALAYAAELAHEESLLPLQTP